MTHSAIPRRGFLQLMAGVPLAFGLWRLPPVLADDHGGDDVEPAGPSDPTDGVAWARQMGRPILAIESPADYMARQRLARQLHELLGREDALWRHVLANLVIVVAPADTLRALFPELPVNGCKHDPRASATLIETCREVKPGQGVTLATGLCEENAPGWAQLPAALEEAVLSQESLERRAGFERQNLAPEDLVAVESALASLDEEHSEAVQVLEGYRASIMGTLTLAWRRGAEAEGAKISARRAYLVAGPEGELTQVRPLGTHWANFSPGCGVSDPYQDQRIQYRCGRGSVSGELRPYLQLLGPSPGR